MGSIMTPEQRDEQELREVEGQLKEVLGLLSERKNRTDAEAAVQRAREARDQHSGNRQSVYHHTSQHHAPTTMHTKTRLDLAEQLKVRIQTGKYALELEDSLSRLSERYVAVLERMLERTGR